MVRAPPPPERADGATVTETVGTLALPVEANEMCEVAELIETDAANTLVPRAEDNEALEEGRVGKQRTANVPPKSNTTTHQAIATKVK